MPANKMLHVYNAYRPQGVYVKPELSIKLDYLKDRRNPAEIFEAMALYINAYRDFGQLLSVFWSSKSRHFVFIVFILNRTHVAIGRMKPF